MQLNTSDYNFRTQSFNIRAEYGNQSVRISFGGAKFSDVNSVLTQYKSTLNQLQGAAAPGSAVVNQAVGLSGISATFAEAAYVYDSDQWLVTSEWIRRSASSLLVQNVQGFYLIAGYHLNNFTPYLQYDVVRLQGEASLPVLTGSGVALINRIDGALTTLPNRQTWSCGLRWDPKTNFDIKLQYDLMLKPTNSQGAFININPATSFVAQSRNVQVFAAALDFVF